MEEMTTVEVGDLNPGDKVLWNDRKEALEVTDDPVSVSGGADLEAVVVKSKRGTTYVVHEAVYGTPKVKREVTPDVNNPNGMASEGYAENLRKVDSDE